MASCISNLIAIKLIFLIFTMHTTIAPGSEFVNVMKCIENFAQKCDYFLGEPIVDLCFSAAIKSWVSTEIREIKYLYDYYKMFNKPWASNYIQTRGEFCEEQAVQLGDSNIYVVCLEELKNFGDTKESALKYALYDIKRADYGDTSHIFLYMTDIIGKVPIIYNRNVIVSPWTFCINECYTEENMIENWDEIYKAFYKKHPIRSDHVV